MRPSTTVLLTFKIALGLLAAVPAPRGRPSAPELVGPTLWGEARTLHGSVFIQGHPGWEAEGVFLPNGRLVLFWTCKDSGRTACSSYAVGESGSWEGLWGWDDEAAVDEDGNLSGAAKRDRLTNEPKEH